MKKTTAFAVILSFLLSLCGCGQSSVSPAFIETTTPEEVISLINEIGDADLSKEAEIESAFLEYSRLDDAEKASVTNYDKLAAARATIAKLYNTEEKECPRMDRTKINIGTYCVYNSDEEHIKWLSECGIDFIVGAPYNTDFLDLCEKYDVGAFISYLPGWYGQPANAGQLSETNPSGCYDSYAENFTDHPSIWALDVGDEPCALDFPQYGILINEAKALFPNLMPYLNLHPMTSRFEKMYTDTYAEYISEYIKNVDTDYICYDRYSIHTDDLENINVKNFNSQIENLRCVVEACKETDADLWVVFQAGSLVPDQYLTEKQIRIQAYSALAFGATVISWACWENGWFEANTNMIDSEGNRTPAYYNVQATNKIIDELSPVYMKYENISTTLLGNIADFYDSSWDPNCFMRNNENAPAQDMFQNIRTSNSEALVLSGYFEKKTGEGEAMLFLNTTDWGSLYTEDKDESTRVYFTLKEPAVKVVAYYPETAFELTPVDGVYSLDTENADGVFVTVEH